MSTPNTPTAQFLPVASMRITDPVVMAAIAAQYGFGVNIIYGVSPQTLASTYGITWVNNPATADYGQLPAVFTLDTASKVLGTSISTAANGVQTLTGQNYTDQNGQVFTSVTWEWQVEVQFFTIADAGTFATQVVQYTGDGTSNRSIATTLDLSTGSNVIIIFSDGLYDPVMCTTAMLAAGRTSTWATDTRTDSGVMAMGNLSFTVKDNAGQNVHVNTNGSAFTAMILHDTTGHKLFTGEYLGTGIIQSITTAAPSTDPLSMVWVAGRGGQMVIRDNDHMPAGQSFSLQATEAKSITNSITAISGSGFTLGTDNNVNAVLQYHYAAFSLAVGDAVRTMIDTFTVTGNGSTVHVTGLGFTPSVVVARPTTTSAPNSRWRGPGDTGTNSHPLSVSGGTSTDSIVSIGVGDIGMGIGIAANGVAVYGFAVAGGSVTIYPTPTWTSNQTITNEDGTTSVIQNTVQSQTSPGADFTLIEDSSPAAAQWWCNATFGYSIFQIDSPGSGWVACVGPATKNGWYLSTQGFGGPDITISGGRPANPRAWIDIVLWATANTGMLGGSPQAAAFINNTMVYPGSGYTVGTAYPPIRIFNGRADRELCRLPPTTANVVPKAVISMLVANGTIYLTTFDSGTSSTTWAGRVFQLDPATGVLTVLGTVFTAGELPYALAWHMGRLWCGTNNGIGTVGKVYYFRPGIDTAWTLDHSTSTDSAGGVDSMASYKGLLYVGTDNAAGSRGKILARDTAGAYTVSRTGSGGTAVVNNGYLALTEFNGNLYASYWNNDTTAVSKIEKFDNSAWSLAYTGASGTNRPFIVLAEDDASLFAVGGGKLLTAAMLVTGDGTTWTDETAELPETDTTLLPMFGAVVL